MNKELTGFFFIFFALFIGAIYYSDTVQKPFISTLNQIKSYYHISVEYVEDKIQQHTNQAKHIKELKKELIQYENSHLVMKELLVELNELHRLTKSTLYSKPQVELARTISYVTFGDLNRLWLEIAEYDSSKIYGLVYKEMVAGIVIPKADKPMALLNNDIKSSYSVFIGKHLAPGIAHGNNAKTITIDFIPAWYTIKEGDEVITSGLDDIFFKGLKVGKVLSVSSAQGYQSAIVEPYFKPNNPNYFYVIKGTK